MMGSIREEILDNWCYLCQTGLGCEHTKKEANTEVNAEEWLDSDSENLYEAEDIIKSQLNRITELEQEIQPKEVEIMEWISVEDRLPEKGENVLLLIVYQRFCGGSYCEDEIIITGGIDSNNDWLVGNKMLIWDYDFNLGFLQDDITHWMPLPGPPKES